MAERWSEDLARGMLSMMTSCPTAAPTQMGGPTPRPGGSCEPGEICHRQPAACWCGGAPVTQPAEGVVRRLLAPAWAPWEMITGHPPPHHGLHWPHLAPGGTGTAARPGLRGRVYRRNVFLPTSKKKKKKKKRMGGGLSQPRHELFSKTQPQAPSHKLWHQDGVGKGS